MLLRNKFSHILCVIVVARFFPSLNSFDTEFPFRQKEQEEEQKRMKDRKNIHFFLLFLRWAYSLRFSIVTSAGAEFVWRKFYRLWNLREQTFWNQIQTSVHSSKWKIVWCIEFNQLIEHECIWSIVCVVPRIRMVHRYNFIVFHWMRFLQVNVLRVQLTIMFTFKSMELWW